LHQQIYYTHFPGFYIEDSLNIDLDGNNDVTLVLGCKTYYDFSGGANDNNDLFGQCMEGWIHTLEIETYLVRTQELAADIQNNIASRHHATFAGGEDFINTQQATYTNNGAGDDWSPALMTIQDTQLFVWDLLDAPGADQSTSD